MNKESKKLKCLCGCGHTVSKKRPLWGMEEVSEYECSKCKHTYLKLTGKKSKGKL